MVDMICPRCSSASLEVLETRAPTKTTFRRRRRCKSCRLRWSTTERIDHESFADDSSHTGSSKDALPVASAAPLPVGNASPTGSQKPISNPTGSVRGGGKGGDLPLDPIRPGSPDPSQQTPQVNARARADGLAPYYPPRRLASVGAATEPFLRCYNRYPNRYRKVEAAQTWQELAESWPGGEAALADAICAAFDAGLLTRHPYRGEASKRPKFETFLAERMWEDDASDPDNGPRVETFEQARRREERELADRRAKAERESSEVSRRIIEEADAAYAKRNGGAA